MPTVGARGLIVVVACCCLSAPSARAEAPAETNLAVWAFATPDPQVVGGKLTFFVDLINFGAAPTDVRITMQLSPDVTFVDFCGPDELCSQDLCSQSAGEVICDLHAVDPGAFGQVAVRVLAPMEPGIVETTAAATAGADEYPLGIIRATVLGYGGDADIDVVWNGEPPAQVLPGGSIEYPLYIRNLGPGVATGVSLRAELPPGTAFLGASLTSCHELDGGITCDIGDMVPGAPVILWLYVQAPEEGDVTMRVAASADNDVVPDNDAVEATTEIVRAPSLIVWTWGYPDPQVVGHDVYFVVAMANVGVEPATGVRVTDQLPPEATLLEVDAACSQSGSEAACELPDVPPGAFAFVTFHMRAPLEPGTLTNQPSIETNEKAYPLPSVTTTVLGFGGDADLSLTWADPPPTQTSAGAQAGFSAVVHDLGPGVASGVTVELTIPAGAILQYGAICPPYFGCNDSCREADGRILCDVGDMVPGEDVYLGFSVSFPTTTGSVTTRASVRADNDVNPDNDAAEATTELVAAPALSVWSFAYPDPQVVGGDITYVVNMINTSQETVTGVTLEDHLPPEATLVDFCDPSGNCRHDVCTASGGNVTCALPDLEPGGYLGVFIHVRAPAQPGTLVNDATVTAGGLTYPLESVTTQIIDYGGSSDLSVTLYGGPPTIAGEWTRFELIVSDHGPGIATGVSAHIGLPPGATFLDAYICGGGEGCRFDRCEADGDGVTCTIGDALPSSTRFAFVDLYAPPTPGLVTIRGSVTSDNDDVPGNDSVTMEVEVTPAHADLALAMEASPAGPAGPRGVISYRLVVTQNGPNGASGVVVTDQLPAGTLLVAARACSSSSPDCAPCSEAGGLVTCDLGRLGYVGQLGEVFLDVLAPASAGPITNFAVVGSEAIDEVPENDEASLTTEVAWRAEVAYAMSARTTTFAARDLVLGDAFEEATYRVLDPQRFMSPADVGVTALFADGPRHVSYDLDGPHQRRRGVVVENQLGTISLDTSRAAGLLVPASAQVGAGELPPAPIDGALKCYAVKLARGSTAPPPRTVTVHDALGGTRTITVGLPSLLCAPALVGGGAPQTLAGAYDHLVCYDADAARLRVPGVRTLDLFGELGFRADGVRELCLPSARLSDGT